jgi:hypothetical protein
MCIPGVGITSMPPIPYPPFQPIECILLRRGNLTTSSVLKCKKNCGSLQGPCPGTWSKVIVNSFPVNTKKLHGTVIQPVASRSRHECVTITHSPMSHPNLSSIKLSLSRYIINRNFSSINLVFIFRCSSSPRNPVYVKCVGPTDLDFSFSSYRHSHVSFLFTSLFLD